MSPITVYAPNIQRRNDRRESIKEQFAGKNEFTLHVIPALEWKNAPWALWQTFYNIVEREKQTDSAYFIFSEDDHVFTPQYSWDYLYNCIQTADALQADLLSGGMSVVKHPVYVRNHLFWVSSFNGMQFTVIFNRMYDRILASKTNKGYVTDIHLSFLAKRKFVIYPYISIQKEFGYSDATSINNEAGRVTRFFQNTQNLLSKLEKVRLFYEDMPREIASTIMEKDVSDLTLPVYIINLKERSDRRHNIQKQFVGRDEFQIHLFDAYIDEIGAIGLWKSICTIVQGAKEREEDFILICEDDHKFTSAYNKEMLLRQIMLAGALGAQLLNGGAGGFGNLVSVGNGLYWTDWFWSSQFMVVYKCSYDIILNADFGVRDVADEKLSSLLTAKLIIAPNVSIQEETGYSDITDANNTTGTVARLFEQSRRNLTDYYYAKSLASTSDLASPIPEAISIQEYLQNQHLHHCLQLGCGHNLLQGWLNTDAEPTYGVTFLDVTQPFKLPEASFDFIFCEHLLDLMPIDKVEFILRECFRILKDGGVLRLTLYSPERLLRLGHDASYADKNVKYSEWNLRNYTKTWAKTLLEKTNILPPVLVLSNFASKMKGKFLYDISTLSTLLESIGYTNIQSCPISESSWPTLQNIERYQPYIPKEIYSFEVITLEAAKR